MEHKEWDDRRALAPITPLCHSESFTTLICIPRRHNEGFY